MNFILYSSGFLVSSLVLHSCIPVIVPVHMILLLYYEKFGIYSMFLWLLRIFGNGRETIFLRPLRRNNMFPALPKFASIVIKNIVRLDGFLTKWTKNSLFPCFFWYKKVVLSMKNRQSQKPVSPTQGYTLGIPFSHPGYGFFSAAIFGYVCITCCALV